MNAVVFGLNERLYVAAGFKPTGLVEVTRQPWLVGTERLPQLLGLAKARAGLFARAAKVSWRGQWLSTLCDAICL